MANVQCFAVVSARAAEEFHRLPSAVRDLLRLCDGTRTLEAIAANSELPAARAEQALKRLTALGVVSVLDVHRPRQRRLTPVGVSWIEGAAPAPKTPAPAATPAPVAAAPAAHRPGFSDEEEQFFSSSIEHLLEDA